MSTKALLVSKLKILSYYLSWRVCLLVISYVAVILIPRFGASFPYWEEHLVKTGLPNWIWEFGNFDGVHYLNIAKHGYVANYTQAFFPLFPLIIRYTSVVLGGVLNIFNYNVNLNLLFFISAVVISMICFYVTLVFSYKLFLTLTDEKCAKNSIVLFLLFPTSFFMTAIYSESLFFMLAILAIYCLQRNKVFVSIIFIALATATRVVGIALIIALIAKLYSNYKNEIMKLKLDVITKIFVLLLVSSLGIVVYMIYLWMEFGDPVYFLTSQPAFGAGRSSLPIITLPQVIFRYLKMFVTVEFLTLRYFTVIVEFVFGTIPFLLLLYYWKKLPLYIIMFVTFALLIPTLTGSFLSMPRFALALFPIFPYIARSLGKNINFLYIVFAVFQITFFSIFIRGYWIS